jgi:hypothetical protein
MRTGFHNRDSVLSLYPDIEKVGYKKTSSHTLGYNCIAWAAGDDGRWWEPQTGYSRGGVWPDGCPHEDTLDGWMAALGAVKFVQCADGTAEKGYHKVAIFGQSPSDPEHVAWQNQDGVWCSKLGEWEDVEHKRLEGARNRDQSKVLAYMKRPAALRKDPELLKVAKRPPPKPRPDTA